MTLNALVAAGKITAASAHVANAIARRAGEIDPGIIASVACLVSAQERGNVCLSVSELGDLISEWESDLDELGIGRMYGDGRWRDKLLNSALIGEGETYPLVLDGKRLYLQRNWIYECRVAAEFIKRMTAPDYCVDVARLSRALVRWFGPDSEKTAVELAPIAAGWLAAIRPLLVITGGPGTGKTTALAKIIGLLCDLARDSSPRIGVAAPTGKGARRAESALRAVLKDILPRDGGEGVASIEAMTLHRLLGKRPGETHSVNRERRVLPFDVLIVDETSMVDLRMMSELLGALAPNTKLILIGDPEQLAAVDAGAVLSEICSVAEGLSAVNASALGSSLGNSVHTDLLLAPEFRIPDLRIVFRQRHRFAGSDAIAELADAVRCGQSDRALEILKEAPGLCLTELRESEVDLVVDDACEGYWALREAAARDDITAALECFGRFQVLSPYRFGPLGTRHLNQLVGMRIEELRSRNHGIQSGTPLIVEQNDYDMGLFNGDVGIVVAIGRDERVIFPGDAGGRYFRRARLPASELAYALTVHKAQGSEYEHVMLVLPSRESDAHEPLLSRQLLYTALSRARKRVSIYATPYVVARAIGTSASRSSGLGERLTAGCKAVQGSFF